MPTPPATVAEYLASLPGDRRKALEAIRKVVRKHLPKGYQEGIQYGMLGYFVPHKVYPHGYHCDPKQPLPFVSFASQKNHIGLYLFCVYMDSRLHDWFVKEWKATGKKLDMGKACVRVKGLDDVPLDVVGELIARCPCDEFIAQYEASLPPAVKAKRAKASNPAVKKVASKTKTKTSAKKASASKPAVKKKASKAVAKKANSKKVGKKAARRTAR